MSNHTDRELIELAARAFGFGDMDGNFIWTESEYPRGSKLGGALWNYMGWCETAELWNPLTDDGDAFRLALKLRIKFERHPTQPYVAAFSPGVIGRFEEPEGSCVQSATRRAIVRAAAAVVENQHREQE